MTGVKAAGLLCLVLLAVASDMRTKKIKNGLNFFFIFFGLVLNVYMTGFSGLIDSLAGIAAPLALLITLYAMGMLGAGDIKLFAAIGSITGLDFILATMVLSFLIGGFICLVLLIAKGYGRQRSEVFKTYLKTCLLSIKIHDYKEYSSPDGAGWFRFSLAVAPAVAAQIFLNLKLPFFHLGM